MDKDYNGYALRLMQSISYFKQYDLDTGEMSYRDGKAKYREVVFALATEDSHVRFNDRGY